MALVKATSVLRISRPICAMSSRMYSDDYGKAGAIREAGGAFGKREAAQEEQYFRKLQGEQLKRLKDHLDEEITFHQAQMKIHKEAAERHEKRVKELQEKKKSHDD